MRGLLCVVFLAAGQVAAGADLWKPATVASITAAPQAKGGRVFALDGDGFAKIRSQRLRSIDVGRAVGDGLEGYAEVSIVFDNRGANNYRPQLRVLLLNRYGQVVGDNQNSFVWKMDTVAAGTSMAFAGSTSFVRPAVFFFDAVAVPADAAAPAFVVLFGPID